MLILSMTKHVGEFEHSIFGQHSDTYSKWRPTSYLDWPFFIANVKWEEIDDSKHIITAVQIHH